MQAQQNIATAMPGLIADPAFPYVPAANTDVTRTFRKHGWSEPDRAQQRAMKRLLNRMAELELDELDDLAAV